MKSTKKMAGLFLLLVMIMAPLVSAKGCVYKGVSYPNGAVIPNICAQIKCVEWQWQFMGWYTKICKMCSLENDPHITTFDSYYYHWHGKCNYSISQSGFQYYPKFGIYGQFRQCNGLAACASITTFTDHPNRVITVKHSALPNIQVNTASFVVPSSIVGLPVGNPSNPILAWYSGSCASFIGSQGYILTTCPNQIYVRAHNILNNKINGLCGHFNNYQPDDFTARSGTVYGLNLYPFIFPFSWKTAQQSEDGCKEPCKTINSPNVEMEAEIADDPCNADDRVLEKLREVCSGLFQDVNWDGNTPSKEVLESAILSCISDLCLMEQNCAQDDEMEIWKKTMQEMLLNNIEMEASTTESDAVTETPGEMNLCQSIDKITEEKDILN